MTDINASPVEAGWVLVPKEPTEAMRTAGGEPVAVLPCHTHPDNAVAIYRAMIAAAPSPAPLVQPVGEEG